ncbi:hypothetical protein BWI17_14960 [Betaproteobacteria bacterium GR16-43]|nr:hypothetical protein BWI17_14960 [Betaproteobacteria bacterium GR16-43]
MRAALLFAAMGFVSANALAYGPCESPAQYNAVYEARKPWGKALAEKRFDDVEQHFSSVLKSVETGAMTDAEAAILFGVFEDKSTSAQEPLHREWIKRYPKSEAAYLAAAIYYLGAAHSARGSKFAEDTSDEQFEAMGESLVKANGLLDEAQRLSKRPAMEISQRIRIATNTGNPQRSTQLYRKAIQDDPRTLTVRVRYAWASNPKWGGSVSQLTSIVEDAKGLPEPDQRYVKYLVQYELASSRETQEDVKGAVEGFEKTYPLCPGLEGALGAALRLREKNKEYAAALPLAEEFIKRYPERGRGYVARGWSRYYSGQVKESIADYERAAELNYGRGYSGLAWYYETGTVVAKDPKRASELYLAAAAQGVPGAKEKAAAAREKAVKSGAPSAPAKP